jgi:predicted metal-dependent peptidase
MNEDYQKVISASLLRLRMKSPFFATLALFARFIPSPTLPTAATDGKNILFNRDYLLSLPSSQQDGLLLHEVLHAALLHVPRRGERARLLWNIAADIVVNGIVVQQGCFELPDGGLRDTKLEHLSVEEIYELLQKQSKCKHELAIADLLEETSEYGDLQDDNLSQNRKASLENHWRNAMQQATAIARTVERGTMPERFERELGAIQNAQIDWRSYLWRYLVQTPTDFFNFDRRFIGRGLYLENLEGETVQVYVAVDTSGSIDNQQLNLFLDEVRGILNAYPHLKCELYYVDAEAYGPYNLHAKDEIPLPKGGGGTSFVPFFAKVEENWDRLTPGVCVYLTDGYGDFPVPPPELPTLWAVTPGGLDLSAFPFGEAVCLISV